METSSKKKLLLISLTLGVICMVGFIVYFSTSETSHSQSSLPSNLPYYVAPPTTDQVQQQFNAFIKARRKFYFNKEEYEYRFKIYKSNIERIAEMNAQYFTEEVERPEFEPNGLEDLTQQEFEKYYLSVEVPLGFDADDETLHNVTRPLDSDYDDDTEAEEDEEYVTLSYSLSWREDMNGVRNQRNCGSCWAFAVLAPVEILYKYKYNRRIDLSQQQLVDCSDRYGNRGCRGGWTQKAYKYLYRYDAMSQNSYRYAARDLNCRYNQYDVIASIRGYSVVKRYSEYALMSALRKSPVTVVMDSSTMMNYKRGIMRRSQCKGRRINHAVTLIGYGQTRGIKYWQFLNSWGSNWGYNGVGYIERGPHARTWGACGIAYLGIYPKV